MGPVRLHGSGVPQTLARMRAVALLLGSVQPRVQVRVLGQALREQNLVRARRVARAVPVPRVRRWASLQS